ncbi:zf-HC2 domain-containing protein [Promicromonospora sp. NPDC060271]|uniref:zf-HC2 domain-containing protein n=1 Tax=Promicromonospora sp. NPDC060271 TaxID=3347089 RepID=UPI00365A4A15
MTATGAPRVDRPRPGSGTEPGTAPVDRPVTRPAAAQPTAVAQLRSALAGLTDPADRVGAPVRSARSRDAYNQDARRPECRAARAALHDYLHGRLAPGRRHRVELHLDGCAGCTRAFIDVREVSWTLRGLGRRLVADGHRGGRHRAPRAGADAQD